MVGNVACQPFQRCWIDIVLPSITGDLKRAMVDGAQGCLGYLGPGKSGRGCYQRLPPSSYRAGKHVVHHSATSLYGMN